MKVWLLIILIVSGVFRADAQKNAFINEFGFTSDNDAYLFYGQDRYYTNGLFLYFRHALNPKAIHPSVAKKIIEFSAGQQMFNPRSGYSPDPLKQDRPFAGYLFGGFSYNIHYQNGSYLKTGMEVGVVGPSALGEDAQKLLHKTIGFYEISGWEYQIKDVIAVNAKIQFLKELSTARNGHTDFSFLGNAKIGSTYLGIGGGVLFRAGRFNRSQHSASANARIGREPAVSKEFFFYARPGINYVAYDATVEGSAFNDTSPVTFKVKPFVFSQIIGATYAIERFSFDYHMQFNSREIQSPAKPHQFGSLSVLYRFN